MTAIPSTRLAEMRARAQAATDQCYYLSGPMSGLPEFNFPAFQAACDDLRGRGLDVRSPHEKGSEGSGMTWESYLREDIGLMLACSALILLPGWPTSKGAKLELSIALGLNWPIYFYASKLLIPMQGDLPDCLTALEALTADLAALRQARDEAVVRANEMARAHALSFSSLNNLSIELLDGEVDDYNVVVERILSKVAGAEAEVVRLTTVMEAARVVADIAHPGLEGFTTGITNHAVRQLRDALATLPAPGGEPR